MGRVRFRPSEWVVVVFFAYTALLALVRDTRPGVAPIIVCVNALVVCGLLLVSWVEPLRRPLFLSGLRDLYKLPLLLLAYREMGWMAPRFHTFEFERAWIVWDRMVLRQWGLRAAVESLGPIGPGLLEISYSLVYAILPFSLAGLYLAGRRERGEPLLFQGLMGVLACYVLFPFFPSEPPRTVFPGEDFPSYYTVFRAFNWGLLGQYGIHMSVFPSAHVAGAFSAAWAMVRLVPERPWVGRGLVTLATLIALATVYGRYHYAADAVAGLAVAAGASLACRLLSKANS
jgi:membrane-associated phospholipid phosphatase